MIFNITLEFLIYLNGIYSFNFNKKVNINDKSKWKLIKSTEPFFSGSKVIKYE